MHALALPQGAEEVPPHGHRGVAPWTVRPAPTCWTTPFGFIIISYCAKPCQNCGNLSYRCKMPKYQKCPHIWPHLSNRMRSSASVRLMTSEHAKFSEFIWKIQETSKTSRKQRIVVLFVKCVACIQLAFRFLCTFHCGLVNSFSGM